MKTFFFKAREWEAKEWTLSSLPSLPFLCFLIGTGSIVSVRADEFFTSKIEPILKQRCFECHSHEKKMKGGLTLDSKSGWEQGGVRGLRLSRGSRRRAC